MQVLDFSTTNTQETDWVINVADANPVNIEHDVFYNKVGKLLVASTGAGGGGTLLVETTDYALGGAFTDGDFPTSISPDVGYTTIAITNPGFQSTDIYISYYPIMDIVNASRYNALASVTKNLSANTTLFNDTESLYLMTAGASDKTVILPPAAHRPDSIYRFKKVDSGVGALIIDGLGSETIDGDLTVIITKQYTQVGIVSDGTDYHIVEVSNCEVFKSGDVSNADFTGTSITITHDLRESYSDLIVKVFVKSDKTSGKYIDPSSFAFSTSAASTEENFTIHDINSTSFTLQFAANGIYFGTTTAGTVVNMGGAETNGFYKVVAYKPLLSKA